MFQYTCTMVEGEATPITQRTKQQKETEASHAGICREQEMNLCQVLLA